jgi:uncharacterized protein YuzE
MMKQEHDAAGTSYITLRPMSDGCVARTVEIDDDTNVDLDADGKLLGIEVLNTDRLWPLAEIVKRWDIDASDAAMLMAAYPCSPPKWNIG